MKKSIFLLYGIIAYLIFFGSFCYAIGFVSSLVVPKHIDSPPRSPLNYALWPAPGMVLFQGRGIQTSFFQNTFVLQVRSSLK